MLRLRHLLENNELEYLSSFVQFELRSLMSCHMTFFSCLPSLSGPSTHTYSTQYVLGHKISFFLIFKKEMLKTIKSFGWILFMIIIFFNSCFFWFAFSYFVNFWPTLDCDVWTNSHTQYLEWIWTEMWNRNIKTYQGTDETFATVLSFDVQFSTN